jgi:hypothetical protein
VIVPQIVPFLAQKLPMGKVPFGVANSVRSCAVHKCIRACTVVSVRQLTCWLSGARGSVFTLPLVFRPLWAVRQAARRLVAL